MAITSIPAPVVPWETVVSTSDPTNAPTRARIRRLREHGLVSSGVRVHPRSGGKASGSQTLHSSLYALSLKAHLAGDVEGAEFLRHRASAIEETFADLIRDFVASHSVGRLSDASFFPDLAGETESAVADWRARGRVDYVFATGVVAEFGNESVVVEAKAYNSEQTFGLDLPAALLKASGLSQGDHVWIFRQMRGTAAIVDVLPALTPQDVSPSGAAKRHADDAYLTAGPGALPSAHELDFLRSVGKSRVRRRVVRPAG